MTLTIRTLTTRLEGEDRRCWLERTTPQQRKTVAGYELHSYTPIRCLKHIDRKDCLFITLERWIDYPQGRRDVQRVQLLINSNGDVIGLHRYPIEIKKWGEPDQPAELEPQPDGIAAIEPATIKNGDRVEFLPGDEHSELAGTQGEALRVGLKRLLARADKTGEPVSISLQQIRFIERQAEPEPQPTPRKPRKSRSGRGKAADTLAAPSA
jgi:hypothetical protein